MLSKYVKLAKKLDTQLKKNKETESAGCDDLKMQLLTLNQSYRVLYEEKEQLAQKLSQVQNKLQTVTSDKQKDSIIKMSEVANNLKVCCYF